MQTTNNGEKAESSAANVSGDGAGCAAQIKNSGIDRDEGCQDDDENTAATDAVLMYISRCANLRSLSLFLKVVKKEVGCKIDLTQVRIG